MGKRLTLTLFAAAAARLALVGLALAKGEKPIVVTVGNLRLTANGNFSPTAAAEEQTGADHAEPQRQDRNARSHPPSGDPRSHRRNRQERRDQRQGPARSAPRANCRRRPPPRPRAICRIGDRRRRHDQRRGRIPRTAPFIDQKRTARLQRRCQRWQDEGLRPRLPELAGLRRGRRPGHGHERSTTVATASKRWRRSPRSPAATARR